MSGAADGKPATTKATVSDDKDDSKAQQTQKPVAQLEEDDEFEDFPIEDWSKEEEVGQRAHNAHMWEESWDDDDTTDDFASQLKLELKKRNK